MDARDVLHQQADLLARMDRPEMARLVRGALEEGQPADKREGATAEAIASITGALQFGEAFHVEANMTALAVRRSLVDVMGTTTFDEHLPPSQAGVMVLEEPIRAPELRGRQQFTHLITWTRMWHLKTKRRGLVITEWNDIDREPDEVWRALREPVRPDEDLPADWQPWDDEDETMWRARMGRWSLICIWAVSADQRLGPAWLHPTQADTERLAKLGIQASSSLNKLRVMCALWDLMGETIHVERRDAPLPRASRRAAQRAKIRPRVQVVTLRRRAPEPDGPTEPTGRHVTVRYPVREHVRNQAYGPGRKLRRKIVIAAHERGPAGAPYSMTQKIYNLER
jgi:hypothetical protein